MKTLQKLLMATLLVVSSTIGAQTVPGSYEAIHDTANSYISYKLDLKEDGSFSFHFYRKNDCSICEEENFYGRGQWKAEGKKVFLSADEQTDVNEQFTLNLNNAKAHFIFKSPRDKSDRIVPTRLKFYEASLFWVKGMEVTKK